LNPSPAKYDFRQFSVSDSPAICCRQEVDAPKLSWAFGPGQMPGCRARRAYTPEITVNGKKKGALSHCLARHFRQYLKEIGGLSSGLFVDCLGTVTQSRSHGLPLWWSQSRVQTDPEVDFKCQQSLSPQWDCDLWRDRIHSVPRYSPGIVRKCISSRCDFSHDRSCSFCLSSRLACLSLSQPKMSRTLHTTSLSNYRAQLPPPSQKNYS